MATLTNNTIATTYLTLLKLPSAALGADASAKFIEDAAGTASTLSLSTTRVGIGSSAPEGNLEVDQLTGDAIAFSISSTDDVAHPFTNLSAGAASEGGDCSANTYFLIEKHLNANGGALMIGLSDHANCSGMHIQGGIGATGVGAAAVLIDGFKSNGSTGGAVLAVSEIVFQIRNFSTDLLSVMGDGDVGIGTTVPDNRLEISFDNDTAVTMDAIEANSISGIHIAHTQNDNAAGCVLKFSTYGDNCVSAIAHIQGSSSDSDMAFYTEETNLTEKMRIKNNGYVGIGIAVPDSTLSVSPIQYSTGTASQSGTTVTGSGTTWTAAIIGSKFVYADGTSSGLVTARASNTSVTVTTSQTVSSQAYSMHYQGLQVRPDGSIGIGTAAPEGRLEIDQLTDDGIAVSISSTDDVAHPFTDYASVNTYLIIRKHLASNGGAKLTGLSDHAGATGLHLQGGVGATGVTTNKPAVLVDGLKSDDGTGGAALVAGETVFQVRSYTTELLSVMGDGKVGIGDTAPSASLHIKGSEATAFDATSTADEDGEFGDGTTLILENTASGSFCSIAFVCDSGTQIVLGRIAVQESSGNDSSMHFVTDSNGTTGERLAIGSGGIITPGTNNSQSFGTDALEWSALWATNTTVQSSDERLKNNIQDLSVSGLEKINALKPRTFDWRKYRTNPDNELTDKGSEIGFIAQEVQSIIPELAIEGMGTNNFLDEDGNILIPEGTKSLGLGMSGPTMIAYMVKAIQELSAKVEALENA